jgi:hypothetical protein
MIQKNESKPSQSRNKENNSKTIPTPKTISWWMRCLGWLQHQERTIN